MRLFAIGGVLLATATAIYLVFLRSSASTSKSTSPPAQLDVTSPVTATGPPPSEPRSNVVKGPRPELQTVSPAGPLRFTRASSATPETSSDVSVSLLDAFIAEKVDEALAADRDSAIRSRVKTVAKTLAIDTPIEVECRTRHCRLKLGGTPAEVMPLVDALQDERGFLNVAQSMMLHREGDEIQIILRFPE